MNFTETHIHRLLTSFLEAKASKEAVSLSGGGGLKGGTGDKFTVCVPLRTLITFH